MKNFVWLLDDENKWELLEKVFSLPVEERHAFMVEQMKKKNVEYLGHTDKSAPEIATECIKKGIKAKSYGHTSKKKVK